ncbi:LOW QUALITY PROTEIN: reverse transcriptase [Phytophthora megakarya]|uniref:Reverse transcriptase n=1 Tax=Phytophthora megakarya TaxID=4795 RepID=A0A225WHK0_9STRA|nr:LOW QUALITY PROTEIN: reverse transcriptase [Phytophthora megakarya]
MSEVFTHVWELLNSRQRATLGTRPKQMGNRNDLSKRCIRAYIKQADHSVWDDHAERLMFALNTSFDATHLDFLFYLVHSWDPERTLKAMLGPTPSSVSERTAYGWIRNVQRDYGYTKACAEDLQNQARRHRSEIQTQKWKELSERLKSGFQKGDAVWLYIPKVQTGLMLYDFRVNLKIDNTGQSVGSYQPSEGESVVSQKTDSYCGWGWG